jgi:hypothetical protein
MPFFVSDQHPPLFIAHLPGPTAALNSKTRKKEDARSENYVEMRVNLMLGKFNEAQYYTTHK